MLKKMFSKLISKDPAEKEVYVAKLSESLDENIKLIEQIVDDSDDIIKRQFLIGKNIRACLFFVDGLADSDSIEEDVIRPLLYFAEANRYDKSSFINYLEQEVITFCELTTEKSLEKAMLPFLSGETLLLIEGIKEIILLETRKFKERAIQEPESEVVVRGPRDGFVETLHTNVLQIRRRIRDPNLVVQYGVLGRRAKSDIAILYIKGVVNEEYVNEIRYRIACIDNDAVNETGTLEQFIEDNVLSIFPQMLRTERPDKTASALMNGQVVIFHDGSPFSLMAPITFYMLFRSPEDYYDRWQIGTLIRTLRYVAAFIAMFLPALYISMVSYNQGMLPTYMALSIAGSREGVPLPAFIEALLMEGTIELLREAGVRLPKPIGQTIGIVGGLVIGDAAVRAGLVSPTMVIVVALTAIASFAIPAYNASITLRILRFIMMLSAATFGLYGMVIVYICINIHLVGLKSIGTYYTSPFAPYRQELLDTVIRPPISILTKRSTELKPKDEQRLKN